MAKVDEDVEDDAEGEEVADDDDALFLSPWAAAVLLLLWLPLPLLLLSLAILPGEEIRGRRRLLLLLLPPPAILSLVEGGARRRRRRSKGKMWAANGGGGRRDRNVNFCYPKKTSSLFIGINFKHKFTIIVWKFWKRQEDHFLQEQT